MLSPRLNDRVAKDAETYQETGNHIEDHGNLQTMPDREILSQKLYYRASGFTGRDLFDLAHVINKRSELLDDIELIKIMRERKSALIQRLEDPNLQLAYNAIIHHPNNTSKIDYVQASETLRGQLLR
jgi:hypothetical protein